jgi:hypothetical protein
VISEAGYDLSPSGLAGRCKRERPTAKGAREDQRASWCDLPSSTLLETSRTLQRARGPKNLDKDVVRELADAAHGICPYSKAVHGNIDVETNVVDTVAAELNAA